MCAGDRQPADGETDSPGSVSENSRRQERTHLVREVTSHLDISHSLTFTQSHSLSITLDHIHSLSLSLSLSHSLSHIQNQKAEETKHGLTGLLFYKRDGTQREREREDERQTGREEEDDSG